MSAVLPSATPESVCEWIDRGASAPVRRFWTLDPIDGTKAVSPEHTKQNQAGKIIQAIAPIVGGKGGGRPDNARGGGKGVGKLDGALAKAKSLLG